MKDTVAVITGAAGHIGKASCKKLASKGVNIAVVDKNEAAGKSFVEELKTEYSVDSLFLDIDLIQSDAFEKAHAEIKQHFGRLDFLVNNAAFYDDIPGWGVPFEQEGYEAWLKVMQVNLLAPFFLVQALAPLLKESKQASVVNG